MGTSWSEVWRGGGGGGGGGPGSTQEEEAWATEFIVGSSVSGPPEVFPCALFGRRQLRVPVILAWSKARCYQNVSSMQATSFSFLYKDAHHLCYRRCCACFAFVSFRMVRLVNVDSLSYLRGTDSVDLSHLLHLLCAQHGHVSGGSPFPAFACSFGLASLRGLS